jgi:hypothetical protein
MSLYVLVTEECQADAESFGVADVLSTAKDQLEKAQRVVGFHDFPLPYIRKRFGNFRLLAARYEQGNDKVIVFLRVLPRSSDAYGDFLADRDDYRERQLRPLIRQDEIEILLETGRRDQLVVPLPELTEAELAFLYHGLSFRNADVGGIIICESPDWVEAFKRPALQSRLSQFSAALVDLAGAPVLGPGFKVKTVGSSHAIYYRYFSAQRKLLLITAQASESYEPPAEIVERYHPLVMADELSDEQIGKYARRAYPELVLADEDAWFEIQRDSEANLALSFEETEVLFSADSNEAAAAGESSGFPLFINGRAGSGKSTILQYLFSDYLAAYLTMPDAPFSPPAYFTYNTELLDRARTVVRSLLRHGSQHLLTSERPIDLDQNEAVVKASFHQFHRFLHDKLPSELSRERFRLGGQNYVTYARFKELWKEKFGRTANASRDFGPDLSWHVIRSYIKGMSLEPGEPLDPEDYQTLPLKQRTVTQQSFERIFDRVYQSWYSELTRATHWDDQDLAHALLERDLVEPTFPAVFCDEAQDFTALELEVLYRLSIFSGRTLRNHLTRRVPFAFAGDPFQTLNPTGFRWDAIKANYTTKLIDNQDADEQSRHEINYRELAYNYRSTLPIVKLCNTLQAIRARLLNVSMAPQTTWTTETGNQNPLWYRNDDPEVGEALRRQAELYIIIPVDEGEEITYVQNDPLLKQIVVSDEKDTPRNVLSPMRAKGLEFNRVALYGFGAAAPDRLLSELADPQRLGSEELLPLEYFVNRLYVAASRPKRRLFVIDTPEGLDRFWTLARDEERLESLAAGLKNRQAWDGHLGMLQAGRNDAWDAERDEPADVAKKLQREGQSKRDPFLLRQAAMQYETQGSRHQATLCRAEAFELEGDPEKAAKRYLQASSPDRAVQALWVSSELDALVRLAHEHDGIGAYPQSRLAVFVQEGGDRGAGLQLLRDLQALAEGDQELRDRLLTEIAWGETTVRVALKLLEDVPPQERGEALTKPIANAVNKLFDIGMAIPLVPYAYVQYLAANDERALEVWNEVGTEYEGADYDWAHKALLALDESFPANLNLLSDAGMNTELLASFEAHAGVDKVEELSQEQILCVAEAYRAEERYEESLTLSRFVEGFGFPVSLLSTLLNTEQPRELVRKPLELVLERLVESSAFGPLGLLVERNELFKSNDPNMRSKQKPINDYLKANRNAWLPHLLRVIARSDELAAAPKKPLKRLYGPLKSMLLDLRGRWREEIDLLEAGAVIERLGSDGDALAFYERVQEQTGLAEAKWREAAVRWIAVRERQARRDRENGNSNNAHRYEQEARRKRGELDLAVEQKLPRYPRLEPMDTGGEKRLVGVVQSPIDSRLGNDMRPAEPPAAAEAPSSLGYDAAVGPTVEPAATPEAVAGAAPADAAADPPAPQPLFEQTLPSSRSPSSEPPTSFECVVGSLRVRYLPQQGRVNIESNDTGELLALRKGQEPHTEMQYERRGDGTLVVAEWGLEISADDSGLYTIRWSDTGVDMRFPL